MTYSDTIIPLFHSFWICVLLCIGMIPFLEKLRFGQYVRSDGPQSHLKKAGTPTMGGLIILLAVLLSVKNCLQVTKESLLVLLTTVGFGMIGFWDDYLKIAKKRSLGLRPLEKLFLQGLVVVVFCYSYLKILAYQPELLLPFSGGFFQGHFVQFPEWLFCFLVGFVMLGTVNGINFTDGLDGLACGVTVLIVVFFWMVSVETGSSLEGLTIIVSGVLVGFLLYNVYPAKVFMGDTGSLALGGFVACVALLLKLPLFIPIVGMVYLLEVVSVVLQVGSYKFRKGKRIFRMAPLHHHFEQCGWKETKVVTVFSVITGIMCIIGYMAL